jgi:hypothetical protein
MSDQQVTDDESPCITGASKSLGQVGYEAMLALIVANPNIPGHSDESPEWWVEQARVWENQPAKLREDWEAVAAAIEIAIKEQIVKEVHEQMTPKKLDFKYDFSKFKPSLEYEAALKKAMDQFHAWKCPKCGAPGHIRFDSFQGDGGFFLEKDRPHEYRITCSKGCEQMGAKL